MNNSKENQNKNSMELLDDFIAKYYKKLINKLEEEENIKLGDWLKMIELKRKLTPADADQKKFWKMLDKIRRETLAEQNPSKPDKKKNRKKK